MNMRKYMEMMEEDTAAEENTPKAPKKLNEKQQLNESYNLYDIWELVGEAVAQAPEQAKAPLANALQEFSTNRSNAMNNMNPVMRELFRQLMEATDTQPDMDQVYW